MTITYSDLLISIKRPIKKPINVEKIIAIDQKIILSWFTEKKVKRPTDWLPINPAWLGLKNELSVLFRIINVAKKDVATKKVEEKMREYVFVLLNKIILVYFLKLLDTTLVAKLMQQK